MVTLSVKTATKRKLESPLGAKLCSLEMDHRTTRDDTSQPIEESVFTKPVRLGSLALACVRELLPLAPTQPKRLHQVVHMRACQIQPLRRLRHVPLGLFQRLQQDLALEAPRRFLE